MNQRSNIDWRPLLNTLKRTQAVVTVYVHGMSIPLNPGRVHGIYNDEILVLNCYRRPIDPEPENRVYVDLTAIAAVDELDPEAGANTQFSA